MDLSSWLGAHHSDAQWHREDWQRRQGGKGAVYVLHSVEHCTRLLALTGIASNPMSGTLTIRNLDESLKARLRLQAARNGHSMEQEAREILRQALQPAPALGLAQRIQARFAGLEADALPIPARRPARLALASEGLAAHEPPAAPYGASPELSGHHAGPRPGARD